MAKYTYDPTQIYDKGLNQMRFELQDNIIEGEGVTCALGDEEYTAIIEHEKTWRKAKVKCLKAIVTKMAYEVTTSTDGLSYSLSERYERWKAMYDEEKKKIWQQFLPLTLSHYKDHRESHRISTLTFTPTSENDRGCAYAFLQTGARV